MSQASSLASIEEDALFFKSNDKLEAYPTIKTRAPKPGWFMVFCFTSNDVQMQYHNQSATWTA